jgi:ABC-type amino acid transport substrate-binding protein
MLRAASLAVSLVCAAALAHAQGLDGRLKKIADTKTIALAHRTDATPFSFLDEKKQPIGYTVDLCKRIATLVAAQVKVADIQVKWVPVTSQDRFEAVAKGRADLECGSSTVTLSRMKQVDFSSFIFVDGTTLLAAKASGVKSMVDVPGKRVAVVAGTTNEKALADLDRRRQLGLKFVTVKSRDEGFAALEEGKVDAFAGDKLLLMASSSKVKDPKAYTLLSEDLSFEPYAIALPRGEAGLRQAVNAALAQIYREGEIVPIFNKWFGVLGEPTGLVRAMFLFGAIPE